MAGHAGDRGQVVVIVDVAIRTLARWHRMRTGQCEVHHGVVEGRRRPGNGGMALRAIRGEVCRDVIGICRTLKILEVASNAGRAGEVVVVVGVAVNALARRNGMSAGQGKSNRAVVELRVQPVVGAVASVAGNGKFRGGVTWVRGRGIVRCVAGVTLRGHRLKLAGGDSFVARITIHRGVRSGERKTIVVLLDLLNRNLPPANGMALLAVRAQLPAMNIGVAIVAALSDVRKDRLDVALDAGDRLMHAPQRISSLVVIELGNRTDRLPSVWCVTVLAGNIQIAVRTVRSRSLGLRVPLAGRERQQQHRNEIKYAP